MEVTIFKENGKKSLYSHNQTFDFLFSQESATNVQPKCGNRHPLAFSVDK